MSSENQVRRALTALNERIRAAHFSPADGPSDGVRPVDVEATIADWKNRGKSCWDDLGILRPNIAPGNEGIAIATIGRLP